MVFFLSTLPTRSTLVNLTPSQMINCVCVLAYFGICFVKMFCGSLRHRPRTYCLADSDEESSSAGSSDEDDGTENVADKNTPLGAEG